MSPARKVEYVHSISDAHIYVDQVDSRHTCLEREPRTIADAGPVARRLRAKTDISDFRAAR